VDIISATLHNTVFTKHVISSGDGIELGEINIILFRKEPKPFMRIKRRNKSLFKYFDFQKC